MNWEIVAVISVSICISSHRKSLKVQAGMDSNTSHCDTDGAFTYSTDIPIFEQHKAHVTQRLQRGEDLSHHCLLLLQCKRCPFWFSNYNHKRPLVSILSLPKPITSQLIRYGSKLFEFVDKTIESVIIQLKG